MIRLRCQTTSRLRLLASVTVPVGDSGTTFRTTTVVKYLNTRRVLAKDCQML
ncbi:MAG: hypothetical protein LBK25_00055 [Treponema sp.]|nr:hypothetical protein [Treponema sp.]